MYAKQKMRQAPNNILTDPKLYCLKNAKATILIFLKMIFKTKTILTRIDSQSNTKA